MWQDKVKAAIAKQAEIAYKKANNGRKRHVPYVLPECAEAMLKALNENDEHEGKRLLLIYRTGSLSLV